MEVARGADEHARCGVLLRRAQERADASWLARGVRGPAPAYRDLVELFAAKLPRVPRYRQVVRTVPMHVFRPAWTDDENFEIGYHMRHAAVPKPGKARQLRHLAGQIFAQRLDRERPLWEAWFLEGIEAGRWALLSKVHHCMVDGIGGTDLMTAVFDLSPDAARVTPDSWNPRPGPSVVGLVATGARDAVTWPLRQLADAPGFVQGRLRSRADVMRFGRGLGGSARRLTAPSASSLNGPIGPHRRLQRRAGPRRPDQGHPPRSGGTSGAVRHPAHRPGETPRPVIAGPRRGKLGVGPTRRAGGGTGGGGPGRYAWVLKRCRGDPAAHGSASCLARAGCSGRPG